MERLPNGVDAGSADFARRREANASLVEELTFYASYHADWRNQLIHIVFVP